MDRIEWVSMEWTQQLVKHLETEIQLGCEVFVDGQFISNTLDETAMNACRAQAIATTFRECIRLIKEGT